MKKEYKEGPYQDEGLTELLKLIEYNYKVAKINGDSFRIDMIVEPKNGKRNKKVNLLTMEDD